jgi:peptide/nickel transport system substrate-binding protein
MLTRKEFLARVGAGGAGLALAPVIAACGSSGSGGTGSASKGGTLAIGYTSPIDTLNPFVTIELVSWKVLVLIYPTLTDARPGISPIPSFAESWTRSPDALTYTFQTRPGGTWTDGKPLTAHDAAFAVNLFVDRQHDAAANYGAAVTGIERAEAVGPNTLVIHYAHPVGPALSNLSRLYVFPEHIWAPIAHEPTKLKAVQITPATVTGGPFSVAKYAQNQIVLLERRAKSYRPAAKVAEIGYVYSSTDFAQIEALKTGETNALDSGYSVPAGLSDLPAQGFTVDYGPSNAYYEVGFTSTPTKPHHRELLDPRVRKALSHAIDRKTFVDVIFYGRATEGSSIIAPAMGEWFNPAVTPDVYDPELTNHMLDQLGYKRGSGGVRQANGVPMSYSLPISTDIPPHQAVAQLVAHDWAQVGVIVTPRILDPAAMFAAVSAPNLKFLDNDVYIWGWGVEPDPDFLLGILTTSQIGGYSDSGASYPAYDRLYAMQARAVNQQERVAIVHQAQTLMNYYKVYLVLAYPDVFTAAKGVHGLDLRPDGDFSATASAWALDVSVG